MTVMESTVASTLGRSRQRDTRRLVAPPVAAAVALVIRLWAGILMLHGAWVRLFGSLRHAWFAGEGIEAVVGGFLDEHSWYSPPVHAALVFVVDHAVAFAWIVGVAELAVGLGVLTGTLLRTAAIGGMALMVIYGVAGGGGQNIEFLVAFGVLVALGPPAGLIGGDGLRRSWPARRRSTPPTAESAK